MQQIHIYSEDGEIIGSTSFIGGEPGQGDVLLLDDKLLVEIKCRRWRKDGDAYHIDSLIVDQL